MQGERKSSVNEWYKINEKEKRNRKKEETGGRLR